MNDYISHSERLQKLYIFNALINSIFQYKNTVEIYSVFYLKLMLLNLLKGRSISISTSDNSVDYRLLLNIMGVAYTLAARERAYTLAARERVWPFNAADALSRLVLVTR